MNNASMRIGVLHFSHETVTFLKNDTTLEDFIYPGSPAKGDALLKFDPKSYMGGFVKMAREFGCGQFWVSIEFGRGNVLVLSTYLVQIMEPFSLKALGLDIGAFDIMAIKSRVHFRRGFHDNGFAKTILLVEPTEPFLGTIHLDKLPYENVDLKNYYPYGNPVFPQ